MINMIDEVLERNKNKNSRAKAQRRKERRNKDIIKGATRWKGKSWEIDFSRKGAKAQRKTKKEGHF